MGSKEIGNISNEQCAHHWVIDSPNGPTSYGQCKLCHAGKYFKNSPDEFLWDGETTKEVSDKAIASEKSSLKVLEPAKRTKDQKLDALSDKEIQYLELFANGYDPTEITEMLKFTAEELARARRQCTRVAGNMYDTIRIGIRSKHIELDDSPDTNRVQDFYQPIDSSNKEILDLLVTPASVDDISRQLGNIPHRDITELMFSALDNIGAKNRYHAAAIMESRLMQQEAASA